MPHNNSIWNQNARPIVVSCVVVLLLLAAGCGGRNLFKPSFPVEELPSFSVGGEAITPDRWWTAFEEPNLDLQIDQALGENFTLSTARQRVVAARALSRREASDLFADVDGIVGFSSTFGAEEDRSTFQWGLNAAYPVDLWGEIGSRVEAQELRADATCLDYHSIALDLSVQIANTWFSLIEAHAQVKLLDEQIKTNRTGSELQESRFGLGLIRSADVLRQRQLLESTLEQSVVANSRIEVLEHQLAILMGRSPQEADYETGTVLPDLPPLPATGLPCELLNRRPDVRRNYVAFQAADRDLASAISAQYPRLSLSGSLLNVSDRPETLLRDWFVSIAGQLIAPLFDGGQRRAEVDRTSAVSIQLFYQYAQSVLTALGEVEDGLAQEKFQVKRIEHLEKQVELAGQASNQLREQYLIGDVEYLDVLSAITGQQSLQRQTLSAQLELVLIRVRLYRALAGDFDTCPQFDSSELVFARDEPGEVNDSEFTADEEDAANARDSEENTSRDDATTSEKNSGPDVDSSGILEPIVTSDFTDSPITNPAMPLEPAK